MVNEPVVKIWAVKWRNRRPRFEPGSNLVALGFRGRDLKHADGRWFTFEEALEESDKLRAEARARKLAQDAGARLTRLATPALGRTLGELCEAVFELPEMRGQEVRTGKKIRKGLSPKTVDGYRKSKNAVKQASDRMWAEACKGRRTAPDALWDTPAAGITPVLMQKLIDSIEVKSGLHQARACRAFLSQLWTRLGSREPGAYRHLFDEMEALPVPEGRVRPWTVGEFAAMVHAADNLKSLSNGLYEDRPEVADMLYFGALTVLRQTDRLRATKLADSGTHLLVRTSKKGKPVKILKAALLAARLDAARLRREKHKVSWPHLVIDEQAQSPWADTGDHYRKQFAIVRKHAARSVPSCADIHDQDLRDTAQTWLYAENVDEKIIGRLAGHSEKSARQMQDRHYIERDGAEKDAGIAAINRMLEGKVK